MLDKGVLDCAKDGTVTGTFIGFAVGSSRAYLSAREFAEKSEVISAATAKANPSLSPRALRSLQPSPLTGIMATTAIYAGLGGVYKGVEKLSENIREKEDIWNRVIGAVCAGSLVGLRTGSYYTSGGAMGALGCMALVSGLFDHIGPHDDHVVAHRKAMYQE